MINIKFITNYALSKDIEHHYKLYLNNGEWEGIIIDSSKPIDYYIIINYPNQYDYFEPKKTIIFQNEPILSRRHWKQWEMPNRNEFLYVYDIIKHKSITGWGLRLNYNELSNLNLIKTKNLSTITSNLALFDDHKLRLQFLKYIDDKIEIDVFGKIKTDNNSIYSPILGELQNYKGSLKDKEEGLFEYKYHFVSENSIEKNYFTEKIIDCILCESLCFYYGAPNIEKFIDNRAYIKIDINKPIQALETIKLAINNNEWEKRIKYIKEEKKKILNYWQMIPTIKRIFNHKLK